LFNILLVIGPIPTLLLFDEMVKRVRARGYQWIDLSLTSADNPKTPYWPSRWARASTSATGCMSWISGSFARFL